MTLTDHLRPVTVVSLIWVGVSVSAGRAGELERARLDLLLNQHCYECHDEVTKKGGLDLTALEWQPEVAENLRLWTKLHDLVERGEMPPAKKERPAADLLAGFLETLHEPLHELSAADQAREGRVVLRRLNRGEYEHTLQDLLGIDTPLRELLPEDGTVEGFDTVGAALNLSAVHLERYLLAADTALQAATITGPQPPRTTIRTDYEETWKEWRAGFQRIIWTRSPEGTLAIRSLGGQSPHGGLQAWNPPVPGERYRFTFRARAMIDRDSGYSRGASKNVPDRRVMLKLGTTTKYHTGLVDPLGYFEMSPDEFREFTVEARIPYGRTIFASPYRAVPETATEKAMNVSYAAVIEWVEIEGPLHEEWPPRGHSLLYGDLPVEGKQVQSIAPEEDARRLLATFLPRVFRRPVTEAEIEAHLGFMKEELAKGRTFGEAIRAAYKLALCSPKFLFLGESPGTLADTALATRLSYALWSTSPDGELTRLAAEGRLGEAEILRAQTDRLLADARGQRFTRHFLSSWLNLREIDFTQPDVKLYPEFEGYLQESMVRETDAFFNELLTGDLSVSNVVHSDFAMLNERLAEHYGIAGVTGPDLRRVTLQPGSRRGGFITQGAILKVSANGTTTSPVVRGAYLLDRILATPPQPPPKNVATIEPDIRGATTIREQLDKHRNHNACAGCHAQLDPPGFALESFDVTGRWREHYRALPESAKDKIVNIPGSDLRYYVDGPVVDPAYVLADGRPFRDVDEYKALILRDPASLAHALTEKFITHLTGAPVQFADRAVVEAIVAKAGASSDYGVRTLLHEVIQSRVFREK